MNKTLSAFPPAFLRALLSVFLLAAAFSAAAQTLPTVEMYKNPYCGCCGQWAEHMRKNGFQVVAHDVEDITAKRASLGMPASLGSCHTAKVGGYLLEGHVPAADVRRLLKEKPRALGLAVPGMPAGSPGMDVPNSPPYETLLVAKDGGTTVFARH